MPFLWSDGGCQLSRAKQIKKKKRRRKKAFKMNGTFMQKLCGNEAALTHLQGQCLLAKATVLSAFTLGSGN